MFGSGRSLDLALRTTTLIILNEETNDIFKIVKSLEESDLLIKSVSETIKYEAREQNCGFLSMLWGTLGASTFRNLLTGRDTLRAGEGAIWAARIFNATQWRIWGGARGADAPPPNIKCPFSNVKCFFCSLFARFKIRTL